MMIVRLENMEAISEECNLDGIPYFDLTEFTDEEINSMTIIF
jgi:hypothetical protein